jgi:anti-anti-sigma factor
VTHTITRPDAATIRVALTGDLDLATNDEINHAIATAVAAASPGGLVVVDLAGVTFLDCSAVGAILHGRNDTLDRDICYQVKGAHGPVARLLLLLELDNILSPRAEATTQTPQ